MITRLCRRFPAALLALAALLLVPHQLLAEVKLPSLFGDSMVLQQEKPVVIWGWADPGEKVHVHLTGRSTTAKGTGATVYSAGASTTADKSGNWRVTLRTKLKAGTQCRLTVKGENTVQVKNILVGEVWVCSGQSNMEWRVRQVNNAKQEIAHANYPEIRLFHIPRRPAETPQKDVNAKWEACTPKTIPNFSAVAYFFGRHLHKKLGVPVGLIETAWGGTRIEPWTPPEGFRTVPALKDIAENLDNYPEKKNGRVHHQSPTALYNGMVAPIVPFSIRGFIWYQGESNRHDGRLYENKMHALIKGWRTIWKDDDLPFYYVQLAPYQYGKEDPTILPRLWEAQSNVLKMKHTGMAVTVDIGNTRDIHPKNKQDVGKRLALWALAKTYDKPDIVYSGPLYKSHKVEGDKIRVEFEHVGGGLVSRDGKPLSWFEIAGKDGKFVKAKAEITDDAVVVWSDDVKNPHHVRYGWHKTAEPNLSNKAGLPAPPFRTNRGAK